VYIIFNGTYMDIYVQVDDKHDDLLINYGWLWWFSTATVHDQRVSQEIMR
jgi:hypothetical protein